MNKAELLTKLEDNAVKVVKVNEEVDPVKNEAGVKSYTANIMEETDAGAVVRNVGFYVIDEGEPAERAFLRDAVKTKRDFVDKFTNYLNGLTPDTYLRFKLGTVDEDDRSGYATAVKKNQDGTGTEVKLFLYRDTVANEQAHVELT